MKNYIKLLTLLLLLTMLLQSTVLSAFAFTPIEITVEVHNAAGQPTKYSSQYNSGQRNVVATTLNGTSANTYYTGSYEYDILSQMSGAELKTQLTNLMKSTHTYTSSYDDCHYKANRTDCENENGNQNKLSLIYTSYTATQSQWNGWNREHIWPKSLGGDTTTGGGADLHHIRPSDASVNSSRGNKKYGNAPGGTAKYGNNPATGVLGGYYNSTYFEPLDNVKGDVARICLYVYIRWGSSWGASDITKVFQSIDVLLEWCALDPVDTWELGRNEVVQDIQGNRNVFIDYPEYAWLIFGKEIPSDMVTPSGKAQSSGHNWNSGVITKAATCEVSGVRTYTCTDSGCNETKTEIIPALGHAWGSASTTTQATCTSTGIKTSTCSRCSQTKTEVIKALGHTWGSWTIDYEATETSTGLKHRICDTCNLREEVIISMLGHEHNYSSVVTAPTCTSEGYTTHTCTCGEYYVDSYKDLIDHDYQMGSCIHCGTTDPSIPTYTAKDFSSVVSQLTAGNYVGEERYNKICEAIYIYNHLPEPVQETVNGKYKMLKSIISQYNNEVSSINNDASEVDNYVPTFTVVSNSAVYFAAYYLLDKKYV